MNPLVLSSQIGCNQARSGASSSESPLAIEFRDTVFRPLSLAIHDTQDGGQKDGISLNGGDTLLLC